MAKPNILLVFSDQFRHDAIEALGNPVVKTPVLNSLVDSSVSFSRAYTPCPVCVPARFAMHTGQMPHRTDVVENHTMPAGRRSFMEILSDDGYQTFGAGKMHFTFETGNATMWGFTERRFSDTRDPDPNDFRKSLKDNGFAHVCDAAGVRSEMYYIPQVSQLPPNLHQTAWTADSCIDMLENRDKDQPFFMMTSFDKPHPPFEPPVPWNKLYRGPDMPFPKNPPNAENLLTLWNKFQNRYKYRDQGVDYNLMRQMIAYYYAEVSFLDYSLGRLLDYMRSENIFEDTLIIFTADHGEMLGDYNSYGKRCFLDSAARIPMIVKYPGCDKGARCNRPASLVDVLPTFIDFADIPSQDDYSGESLIGLADGSSDRTVIHGQYEKESFGNYMRLTEEYKYIYSAPDEKEFLFDLKHDPDETRNKALSPLYMQKTAEMRDETIKFFKDDGYTVPFEGESWKRYGKKTMPEDPDAYLLFQDPPAGIPHIPGYETDGNSKKYFHFHWYEDRYHTV